MLESELGGAREFVDVFKARLQERRGNRSRNVQGETGSVGEMQPKKRRGRPRKQT
jgi:hypothetical protein